jgi:hypothetical protein
LTLFGKNPTALGIQHPLTGPLKYVGNTMQSAYHWPVRINQTHMVNIKGTHPSDRSPFFISHTGFPTNFQSSVFYLDLLFINKAMVPFHDIKVFQKGMMIEAGKTATVLAAGTMKIVIISGFLIFFIHSRINYF